MLWILFGITQIIVIISGIRQEQRTGQWSWSKFVFTLAFAGLQVTILCGPLLYIDVKGPWFIPYISIAGALAALNFIWFIIVCRRWRLPDGRTSLDAYYDEHPKK